MNRSHSNDSLDNEVDNIASSGSSSPTVFTSDDEVSPSNLYMMSGRLARGQLRSRTLNKMDSKHQVSGRNYPRNNYMAFHRNAHHRATNSSSNPAGGDRQSNTMDQCSLEPSTSYYDNHVSSSNMLSSRIPDVVPDPASIALYFDQDFEPHQCNNLVDNPGSHRRMGRHDRSRNQPSSSNMVSDENDEACVDNPTDYVDMDSNLFGRPDSTIQALAGPSRRVHTIAARELCNRLVGTRTLIEAIEYIEQQRELINNLTRIITRAPAYRNYDMSSYQIDQTVKESFNPHFWHDREPIVTTADGNCQYHAVSISLTGSEMYTQEVRLATAVAVVDNREWFHSMLKLIDRGTVLDLIHTITRSFSWGDETTLKAIAVAIKRRIFLYTCNIGKKDYELVKSLSKEELLDAFKEKKYRGGTGIHAYADPLVSVSPNNYIMLFHKSEHFIAVLPTGQQPTMFEPYNPIVPSFS